jgi:hypothetical protein
MQKPSTKNRAKKVLNIRIPADLYDSFAKLCIDYGITKTAGIVLYMKYLKQQHNIKRTLLSARHKPAEPFDLEEEANKSYIQFDEADL